MHYWVLLTHHLACEHRSRSGESGPFVHRGLVGQRGERDRWWRCQIHCGRIGDADDHNNAPGAALVAFAAVVAVVQQSSGKDAWQYVHGHVPEPAAFGREVGAVFYEKIPEIDHLNQIVYLAKFEGREIKRT